MLEKSGNTNVKLLSGIVVLVILFFAINIIANIFLKRHGVDFTEGSVFAISNGTENIVNKIQEPITLQFFYSKRTSNGFPFLKNHAERIRAVLENYASISGKKINLKIIDPESFTDEEDLAIGYGLKGLDLPHSSEKFYLGLVISNARDDVRVIQFFHPDRQRFVEYEISKAIHDLSQKKRPVIGVLSTLPIESSASSFEGGQSWLILEQLKQNFDIINIKLNTNKIPDSVDVLMVVQPNDFTADLLNAIDQYVLDGGKAMVFADPNSEFGSSGELGFSPEFNKILAEWGVEIAPYVIVADRKAARPITDGAESEGKVDYIAWLNIEKNGLNSNDVTTSLLKNVNMATSGYIRNLSVNGINITPLVQTSAESMKISSRVVQGKPDPNKMLSNFISENTPYILAARIEGRAKTAFPERASNPGHIVKSKDNINVVLVADTDILSDNVWAQTQDMQGYKFVTPIADNNSFIANIAELLSGNNDIISLRGRGASSRTFDAVDKIRKNAEGIYLKKEKELKDKLLETETHLVELKKQAEEKAGNKLSYQTQQRQEIAIFTEQLARTKKELRNVQRELKGDVEHLGSMVKFLNILLMPLLISLFAIFLFKGFETRS